VSDTSTQTPTLADYTNRAWAIQVLQDGGFPISENNIDFMLWWMEHENSPSTWTGTAGANNPLNNGLGSGGGSGLGSYPDLATAAAYAAKGIKGGIQGTGPLAGALSLSADPAVSVKALESSGWASGHYGYQAYSSTPVAIVTAAASAAEKGITGPVTLGDTSATAAAIIADAQNKVNGLYGSSISVPGADQAAKALGGAAGVEAAATKVLNDLGSSSWWERVGLFAAGGALVIVGIVVFISTTKTGQKVESDAAVAALA
jgi:hypothetical protein